MHGRPPERHAVKQVRSNWFWGWILPWVIVLLAWPTWGGSFILILGYPILAWKIHHGRLRTGWPARDARVYAFFVVLGKFAQVSGQLKFWMGKLMGRKSTLIEYKHAPVTAHERSLI